MRKPFVLATICARAGSKGIRNKNIRLLLGKPLIQLTLECAKSAKMVDQLIVSTDSIEILELVNKLGYQTEYIRPEEFATDESAKIDAIVHAVEYFEKTANTSVDVVVDLDIGVPMRTPEDIDQSIRKLIDDENMDTLVTVYPSERSPYFNMVEKKTNGYYNLVNVPDPPIFRRQDAPKVFSVTPAVFAWKRTALHIRHLYQGNWGIYEMPIERSIDIDTEFEFKLVEYLMSQKKAHE